MVVPDRLLDSFATDSVKQAQWGAFLHKNHLNLKEKTFLAVVRELRSFFGEILDGWRMKRNEA